MPRLSDPLAQWLSLSWDRPERSYNPDLRDFLAGLLDYPKNKVVTEDSGASGYPDIKLLSPEGIAWVVGDLKKEDDRLTNAVKRAALWEDKRKYVDGLTRYVLFLTAHFLWVATADGASLPTLPEPLNLRNFTLEELQARLAFLGYKAASHAQQWDEFTTGIFPYSYLDLGGADAVERLQGDLRGGFAELQQASIKAIAALRAQYEDYVRRREDIHRNLVGLHETQHRAQMRLELQYEFVRRLFTEAIPQFEDQYGRDIEANKSEERRKRITEAFVADSVAALMARVLFLRLVEDLGLTQKRRLSNGGPRNWTAFIENLTGDARALVRVASEDVARVYREPFTHTVFDWIHYANGELDEALQRLIVRFNAYDFSGLSEEVIGDIYQQFLPPQKRKQLGEYYTPPSIVDWILDQTVRGHGLGTLLDPSCGSGSFLVRYAHWRLEDAAQRHLDPELVRDQVQEEVWGFDLNPFAAFISLFQITWALLRSFKSSAPPHVHVYNLNSLLQDRDIAPWVGEEHLAPGSLERDTKKWRYIVGNPPYIRAERVKYGGEMKALWQAIWDQNSDTGLVFLYRALQEWLEPGGFLGMVVSGGYANSAAAAKVWNLLLPGKCAALRKVVWLEFVEENGKPVSLWDAARVPLILIIERAEAKPEDEIEMYVPSSWPGNSPAVKVPYAQFFEKQVSPKVTNGNGNGNSLWGDYLLPLLQPDDVPLLRRLYPDGSQFQPLGEVAKWTYGIQRGGVDVTDEPTGEKPIQVIAGRSLAVAWPGEPAGWVDLDAVKNRPFGKLSLWGDVAYPKKYVITTTLGKAPIVSVVSDNDGLASVNSTIVSRDEKVKPEAIAAYLNSSLARFYWAVRLRSAVIQGYYATFYPRTFEAMPWPVNMTPEQELQLAAGYDELARLAARAKNSPNEWLLTETERRLAAGNKSLTEPAYGLRFEAGDMTALAEELLLDGAQIRTELLLFAEFANANLAEYVYRVLTLTAKEDKPITTLDAQKLLVPNDYAALMQEYRARDAGFQRVEQDFLQALEDVDTAVYAAFGMTDAKPAIAQRLSTFPLNRLRPRYPWETVRPRAIKSYTEDRFR